MPAAAVLLLGACGEAMEPSTSSPPAAAPEIVLLVDPEGIFVSTEPVRGEWFGGFDVQCLLPAVGQTDGKLLVGRLAGDRPVLACREGDELRTLRPGLRRAAAADAFPGGLPGPTGAAFAEAVRAAGAEPAPPLPEPMPPRAQPHEEADPPLPAGAPVMAWAPEGALVVRFRSVEAAFRFSDLADRMAGLIAAVSGDGGDHGTLRLALHHLLLPSIWRANPNGRKGVAEGALIVPAPYAVGRPRAAVVLRIVDPELHDHETRAGVAMESRPEHLWRPAGDPFPELRVRTAVRAVAGDCEVVATDRALLDAVLAGPGRAVEEWSETAVAARHGLPEPTRRRALTLVQPPDAHVLGSGAASQEWVGSRLLAQRWLGLHVAVPPAHFGGPQPVPAPWGDVVALSVDTDAAGALVSARLASTAAAERLASRLRGLLDGALTGVSQACHDNLVRIVPLGLVEPRASDVAERAFVWFGRRPLCPRGGRYRFHPVTGAPSCSVHGDGVRAVVEQGRLAPSPLSEITVDGSLVTFRWSIDW